MSESKSVDPVASVDADALDEIASEADDTPQGSFDLDALDADGGMDAALAAYRADQNSQKRGGPKRRPLWVSAVAVVLGVGLMAMMWPDFRFWLESQPRDPGALKAAVQSGELADLDNRLVTLEGTPDVTHIVPIKRESGKRFGFMRLLEGDDEVFVFARRKPDQAATEFDAAYTGRLRRAEALDSYDFLREAFALEDVRDSYDVAPEALATWVATPTQPLSTIEGGELTVTDSDRIRLRFRPDLLTLQLGRRHFKTKADAEAAVASLGLPYAWLPPTKTAHDDPDAELPNHRAFHSFLVAAQADRSGAIETQLNEGLDLGDGTDPARGVVALPRWLNYTVAPDKLAIEGETLVFEYGENTADYGHELRGGKLVARELDGPALRIPLEELEVARLQRVVRLSPEAMVLVADETPTESRTTALLFLLVGAIVGLNVAATIAAYRRRQRA